MPLSGSMATAQPTTVPQGRAGKAPPQRRPSTSDSDEEELPPQLLNTQQRLGLVCNPANKADFLGKDS